MNNLDAEFLPTRPSGMPVAHSSYHSTLSEPTWQRTTLRDVFQFLFKHVITIGLCVVICTTLATTLLYLLPPSYSAKGSLVVERGKSPTLRTESAIWPVEMTEAIETEIQLLRSRTVAEAVVDQLKLDQRPQRPSAFRDFIDATEKNLADLGLIEILPRREKVIKGLTSSLKIAQAPMSWIVTLTYSAQDPQQAADVVRTAMDSYLNRRREIYSNNSSGFFANRVNETNERLKLVRQQIDRQTDAAESARLQLERQSLESSYLTYQNNLDRALADAAGDKSLVNVRVVDYPTTPTTPSLSRLLMILVAFVMSAILGLALAFAADFFDHTVRTPADLARHTKIPVLGVVRLTNKKQLAKYLGK
jgi:uncharacterized protein involved in exopolysaccharide biosynthesis